MRQTRATSPGDASPTRRRPDQARPWARLGRLLGLALLGASPAGAQLNQYTLPGDFAVEPASLHEKIDRAMTDSRWLFGKLHLDPWLSLRNLSWVDSGDPTTGPVDPELTATLGAGLRAYLPLGNKATLAAHALPEYVWWQDASERRRFNGRGGAGLFADFGRIALEVSALRDDSTRFFSRELEQQVDQRRDIATLNVEAGLVGGLSTFGQVLAGRHSLLEDEDPRFTPLAVLDREDRVARAGLRYRFARGLRWGVGLESLEIEFDADGAVRDTTGEAVFVELQHGLETWLLHTELAFQSLEIGAGPTPRQEDGVRGRLQAAWRPAPRLVVELFADRGLVYSFQPTSPFFEDTSTGLGLRTSLRTWASFRVFTQVGTNDFANFDPVAAPRSDDLQAFGADLHIGYRGLRVLLGATRTEYDSNIAAFDRTTTVYRSSVVLGYRGLSAGTSGLSVRTGELSPWG